MACFAAAVPTPLKRAVGSILRKIIERFPATASRAVLSVNSVFAYDGHFLPFGSI